MIEIITMYNRKLKKNIFSIKKLLFSDFDLEAGTLNATRAGPRGPSDLEFWEFWFHYIDLLMY